MSYKMRQIAAEMPELEIVHRSFALAWDKEELLESFGTMEKAKADIVSHWKHANDVDPLRRFNIDGMLAGSFEFPTSQNSLRATKAAGIVGGMGVYWDLFDELQKAIFMRSEDVSDMEVIEKNARAVVPDFEAWKRQMDDPATVAKIRQDFELVRKYGIDSVPTLIVDETHAVSGALPVEELRKSFERLARGEGDSGVTVYGQSCSFVDGKIVCD